MKRATIKLYRAKDFAAPAGVTVRTLHYYDRIGLLKPSGRTDAGYRIYAARDLERLEQIIVLKFLGLPLKQIRDLLGRETLDLPSALRETLSWSWGDHRFLRSSILSRAYRPAVWEFMGRVRAARQRS